MSIGFPIISWGNSANIYEVNIRQYTSEGTINVFAVHLPRLKDMGVQILWLMPITPISVESGRAPGGVIMLQVLTRKLIRLTALLRTLSS